MPIPASVSPPPQSCLVTRKRALAETIETVYAGKEVAQVVEGQRAYPLVLRYDDEQRSDLEAIRTTLVDTPAGAKLPLEMLADVRAGIWRELRADRVTIDPFRRELQRSWLTQAHNKFQPTPVQLPPGLPPQFAAQQAHKLRNRSVRTRVQNQANDA